MTAKKPEPFLRPRTNTPIEQFHYGAPPQQQTKYDDWQPSTTNPETDDTIATMEIVLPWYLSNLDTSGWPQHRFLDEGYDMIYVIRKNNVKCQVIKRDLHNLSAEEKIMHKDKVMEAMHRELKQWLDMESVSRMLRKDATNPVDGTWVLKWKVMTIEGKEVKDVKGRWTLRGFKDRQQDVETFSGTAARYSTRIVSSHSTEHGYAMWSLDVSGAFLKGLTFDEINAMSRDGLIREVQLMVDANTAIVLRKFKGWEDFDHQIHCLRVLRPIWGLKDAPRLFTLKLGKVMASTGHYATKTDNKLYMHHSAASTPQRRKICDSLVCGHLDDLKGSSKPELRTALQNAMDEIFGKCSKHIGTFTYLGVEHEQSEDLKSVYTHQTPYVMELREIPLPAHAAKRAEELSSVDLGKLTHSLLGALTWVTQSRPEILVFVGLGQRNTKKFKMKHAILMNLCLQWIQQHPSGMLYKQHKRQTAIYCIADSAFRAEDPDCLALRADLIGSCEYGPENSEIGGIMHTFITTSKKQTRVVRNTFAAELGAMCDSVSTAIIVAGIWHEIDTGISSAAALASLAETQGFSRKIIVFTDSESVFKAVTAIEVKLPLERHLAYSVMKVREWLDRGVLQEIIWIDTRDMVCDSLTKGSIDRTDLMRTLNEGVWRPKHPFKRWSSLAAKTVVPARPDN
jgi:hypothetical protein